MSKNKKTNLNVQNYLKNKLKKIKIFNFNAFFKKYRNNKVHHNHKNI